MAASLFHSHERFPRFLQHPSAKWPHCRQRHPLAVRYAENCASKTKLSPLACALAGLGRYTDAERCPQKCEMLSHVVSSCSRVAQRPSKGKSKLECWLSLPEIAEKCLQITLMTHDGVQSIEGFHPDLFLSTSLRERHPVPQNARHVSTKKPTKSHHPVCTSLANDTHSGCEAHRIWLAVLVATLHPLHTSLDIWPFTSKLLNALT